MYMTTRLHRAYWTRLDRITNGYQRGKKRVPSLSVTLLFNVHFDYMIMQYKTEVNPEIETQYIIQTEYKYSVVS